MRRRGKLIPVMVEIMPGALVDQRGIPGLPQRRPRSWAPKINHRYNKPRAKV